MSDEHSHDHLPEVQNAGGDPDPSGADPLAALLGGLDMGSLLSMAGEMQQQLQQAQQTAAATEVEGSAGGGVVRITLTGAMEATAVTIDRSALDDVEMLGDLVLAALRDALAKAKQLQDQGPLGDLGGQLGGQLDGLFGG